ncbi:hypothetical protein [Trebonia sp.]|nr:hypothetical protein [Trebonia sp.]
MKFANYIRYVQDADAVAAIRPAHRAYLHGLLERGQLAASPRPIRTPSAA